MRAEVERVAAALDQEAAERLLAAFETWTQVREVAVRERKRCTDNVKGRLAQFEEAIQVGHQTTSDQLLKLTVVEQRWQDLDDARRERREVVKLYRDQVVAAEQKIRDLVEEARTGQMSLFDRQGDGVQDPDQLGSSIEPEPDDEFGDDQ